MSGESRCSARESEQDVDQRAEVTEGVVLPERVIVAELVLCLTRRSFLLICCCSGLQKHCIAWTYSLTLQLTWSFLAALCDSLCEVGRTLAAASVPYSSLIMLVAVWKYFAEMYNVFVVAVNLGMLLVELLAVSSYKFSTSVYSYLTIMLFPEAKVLVIFSFVCKEIYCFLLCGRSLQAEMLLY